MIAVIAIMASCSKEGPQGPAGTNGTNGTNGTDGNANVTLFTVETDFSLTSGEKVITLTGLTSTDIEKSLTLGYFQESGCANIWYNAPGLGCNAGYNTRTFIRNGNDFIFKLHNPDGSTYSGSSKTFERFKIIVIPASTTVALRTKKPLSEMTYSEVCKTLNIKEDK